MTSVTVKDLPVIAILDHKAMLAVRGGLSTAAIPISTTLLPSPDVAQLVWPQHKHLAGVKYEDA